MPSKMRPMSMVGTLIAKATATDICYGQHEEREARQVMTI